MQWVRDENAKTIQELEGDRRFTPLFQSAKSIREATDRIPQPQFLNGRIYNFWQDGEHPHGLWRQTTFEEYRSAAPHWQIVLAYLRSVPAISMEIRNGEATGNTGERIMFRDFVGKQPFQQLPDGHDQ